MLDSGGPVGFHPTVEQRTRSAAMAGLHQVLLDSVHNLYAPLGLGGDPAPSGEL